MCREGAGCSFTSRTYPSESELNSTLLEAAGSGDYDHIIVAGTQFGPVIQERAKDFPRVRFSGIDYMFCHTCSSSLTNVEGYIFRDDQIGYVAGVVACEVAESGSTVAVVAGPQDSATKKRSNGFNVGCLSVCPSCVVDIVYNSTPSTVEAQLDRNPQVVFGSGTKVGHDALKVAAAQGIYVIGVDGDEYYSTFEGGKIYGSDKLLTSAMKDMKLATFTSLGDGLSNEFRERNYLLGLEAQALDLAPCHDACSAYSSSLQAQAQDIMDGLANGDIDTGVDRKTGDLVNPLPPPAPVPPESYRVLSIFPDSMPFPDGSYYDQVYSSLDTMCREGAGCSFTSRTYPSESELNSTLLEAAGSDDYDHIIVAGAQFGPVIQERAKDFPRVRFS